MTRSPLAIGLLAAAAILVGAVAAQAEEEKVVNVYNWVDYIGETTIQDFEAETGIKVVYDTYDASETVDAKMMAGHSGYDVVLHGSHLIPPLVKAGVFAKIDKSKLTNYGNLDPEILKVVAGHDPGNDHFVPYMWGTVGFAYNVDMIKQRMPDAPVTSLDMLFKPDLAAKWADCGISILESPTDMIPLALSYLHRDPNSQKAEDYEAAAALFRPIRQYVKAVDSANYLNQLPNQELCLAFSWSGDYATAASRAAEAGVKIDLAYSVPDSGGPAWFDGWLIPSDAPHPENALIFINYMLRPQVIAAATNFTNYANANKASAEFVNKEILENPAIYPDAATRAKLYVPADLPQDALRLRTRAWSQIKAGQRAAPSQMATAERYPDTKDRPWLDPQAKPILRIEGLTKKFADFIAVDAVDLEIHRKELFCLLGGSGCGKTTLLRMLAGFETPSAGRILIDGQDVTRTPPYERPVNMMFQSYALFPHMSVEKNIGYGLKHEAMTPAERRDRVTELLELVQLQGFGPRRPHQLSGGQRQRVALARALAKKPKLLLLDEPLAALDKKLREQTQFELMNIQYQVGVTFIVVTHDQEEAMALSTRIAVMNRGRIVQTGTPTDIYEYPNCRFSADFIGSINLFDGTVDSAADGRVTVATEQAGPLVVAHAGAVAPGTPVSVAVRPEKIAIGREPPQGAANTLQGMVYDLGYFGDRSLFRVQLGNGRLVSVSRQNERRGREEDRPVDWDDRVWLSWSPAAALLLTE